jgi:hypothetical protein
MTVILVTLLAILKWQGAKLTGPGDSVNAVAQKLEEHMDAEFRRVSAVDSLAKIAMVRTDSLAGDIRGLVRLNCIKTPEQARLAGLACVR